MMVRASKSLAGSVLLLCLSSAVLAQQQEFTSGAAKAAQRRYDGIVGRAEREFDRKMLRSRRDYAEALEAGLKHAFDAADLDEANALKAELQRVNDKEKIEGAPPFDSESAIEARKTFLVAVAKTTADRDAIIGAAKKEYLAGLKRALEAALKAGNLEEANRINAATKAATAADSLPEKPTPDDAGKKERVLQGHTRAVWGVAFTQDGKRLLSCWVDRTVRMWDLADGRLMATLTLPSDVRRMIALDDGKRAVVTCRDNSLYVLDLESFRVIGRAKNHSAFPMALSLSPDGKRFVSASKDGTARIWDTRTGKEVRRFGGHDGWVWDAAFSPDGHYVATAGHDGKVIIREVDSGKVKREIVGHNGAVNGVVFTADGKGIVTSSSDGTVRLWDIATGKESHRFAGVDGQVHVVRLSHDGRHVLAGSSDKILHVWELATGKEIRRFEGHQSAVFDVAISPNDDWVATAGNDRTVRLWPLDFEASSSDEP